MRIRQTISLLSLIVWILFSGCCPPITEAGNADGEFAGATVTWSAEASSPDGLWLAVAKSRQWSGPGNAYDATTVYLKWIKGSQPPIEVLGFSHELGTMNLKMEWITPKHLHVIYGESEKRGDHVNINFQAIKCAGIDISSVATNDERFF
jgi:hypothetical protein